MLPKNALGVWARKLIYGWLIFCVGGVGSLAYFDGFLPGHEHGEHPYHVSIFEHSTRADHHLPSQPGVLVEHIAFRLISPVHFIGAAQNLVPGFARFFVSGLSAGYLLTVAPLRILHLPALFASLPLAAFVEESAWIAPPEKPPA